MNEDVKRILEILKSYDDQAKKKLLLETAASIGSEEWREAVKDLIDRMDKLNKK